MVIVGGFSIHFKLNELFDDSKNQQRLKFANTRKQERTFKKNRNYNGNVRTLAKWANSMLLLQPNTITVSKFSHFFPMWICKVYFSMILILLIGHSTQYTHVTCFIYFLLLSYWDVSVGSIDNLNVWREKEIYKRGFLAKRLLFTVTHKIHGFANKKLWAGA